MGLGDDETPLLVPTFHLDPDLALQALLERSRGVVLEVLPGASTKLSRFTLKQIARANPIREGSRRSGLRLRKVGRRKLTARQKRARTLKRDRARLREPMRIYSLRKTRYKDQWQISPEDWLNVLDWVGTTQCTFGRYWTDKPWTIYNLHITSLEGRSLFEGADEYLRSVGYTL